MAYDVIVVGGGPAGLTAALSAARVGRSVLVLEGASTGGQIQYAPLVENYPGMPAMAGSQFAENLSAQAEGLGVTVEYAAVQGFHPTEGGYAVEAEEGTWTGRALVLSPGASHRPLGLPGEAELLGAGVSYCAICDGAACKGKDVVVLGGGNSAVEEAIYLAGLAKSVTVAVRSYLKADPIACDKLRSFENVTVLEGWNASEFCGDGRLRSVRLKNQTTGEEKEVECVQAFEYIGQIPATDCFRGLGVLNAAGYVEADEQMRTKVPGIYAAGDCIVKNLRQVITACADGAIAAQSAAHYIQNLK